MSRIYPLAFFVIAFVTFFYVDVNSRAAKAGTEGINIQQVMESKTYEEHLGQTIESLIEGSEEEEFTLASYLPKAPINWLRRNIEAADVSAITGEKFVPVLSPSNTTLAVMSKYYRASTAGPSVAVQTYVQGTSYVVAKLQYEKPNFANGFGKDLVEIDDKNYDYSRATEEAFAIVNGLPFYERDRLSEEFATKKKTAVSYRRIYAQLGNFAKIEVLTNASDVDIMRVIAGMDVVGLNALENNALAYVSEDKPTQRGMNKGFASVDPLSLVEAEDAVEEEVAKLPNVDRRMGEIGCDLAGKSPTVLRGIVDDENPIKVARCSK